MTATIRVLIVHSDVKVSENIQSTLLGEGYEVHACSNGGEAIQTLKAELFHFVLLDAAMDEEDQFQVMDFINQFCPDTLMIPISWYAVLKSAVKVLHSVTEEKGHGPFSLRAMKMTIEGLSRTIRRWNREKENRKKTQIMVKDLQESNLRLMELDRKKTDCLAVATHELRTPITIVNGYIKLLLGESYGKLNEQQKHLLDESSKNCSRLLDLINSLLDRCRLEAAFVEFDLKRAPYLETLKKVTAQMSDHIQAHGLTVNLELPAEEILLTFDSKAIEQTLFNLIGNAVKFTPPPGEITIRCEMSDQGVLTEVIDTGLGIEPDQLGCVFDEFNKVGRQYGDRKGAGLGLSICKKIIDGHNGKLWVKSRPAQGSCFSFLLPLDQSDPLPLG